MKRLLLLVLLPLCLHAQDFFGAAEYARSHDYHTQHLRLALSFDFPAKKVIGTATLRLEALRGGLKEVALDSALQVAVVTLGGKQPAPLTFQSRDQKLYVTLDRAYAPGSAFELVIKYTAQPRKGLFFIMPDKEYPDRPHQVWSQGEDMDNHYWFPCYDFPNDKTTTEMLVTVPAKWEAVSNGKLVSVEEDAKAGTRMFHWLQDKPHSTYLVSLVAGDYEKVEEKWKGLTLSYYVPQGQRANAPVSFGRTADMMEFFSTNIVPYPWPKYSQSVVEDFTAGGMENTSATTVHRNWLYAPVFQPDRGLNIDDGISHELAHQWFGDLLTTSDWRHLWLNEGFATYFASLWIEHHYGRDEFDRSMFDTERQIANTESEQRFPIVRRAGATEAGPVGLLIYPKGGWILHMMRYQLGDELFWRGIQHYVKKFTYQNVQTSDFVEAIAESTGQNFEWLFDQFVYNPGHPEFEVAWNYDGDKHQVHVSVKQTLKRDGKPALYRVPVDIEMIGDGAPQDVTVWAAKESDDFYFPSAQRPRIVLFDPKDGLLKKVVFKKDNREWIDQLQHAARALNRMEAAAALAKADSSPEIRSALEAAAASDSFYAVRAESLRALRELKSEESRPALLKCLGDSNAEVRRSAIAALGNLKKTDDTIAQFLRIAREDSSMSSRAAALRETARLKPDNAVDLLKAFLDVDSPENTVRQQAIGALGSLHDDKALPLLLEWAKPGKPVNVRETALRALGTDGKGKKEVSDLLLQSLDDSYFRIRGAAVFAIRSRRDMAAVDALDRLAKNEPNEGVARQAKSTLELLKKPPAP